LEELSPRGFRFIGVSDRPVEPGALPESVEVRASGPAGGRIRWEAGELPRILREIKPPPDLFHATWNHGIPAKLPFPSILSLHDVIPWMMPGLVPWPRPALLHRWLYRRAVRASARHASAIVTLSEASRRDIASRIPEVAARIEVVPCAVPRWLKPAPPDRIAASRSKYGGAPYWLYFGGFDPRKGVELLIEAVARAFPERAGAPALVLAGARHPLADGLAGLADAKGLRTYWPGYVPDSELAALLGGAELFIYPSRYEGFGIPPLLAMALGTPCVVSDAGALPEVVGDAAVSFPSGDAGALAERLETVARDPGPLAARSRLGKERAARFSVDLLAERMTRVYEAAAARREGCG
jgi:glycosyltransferase involved in cell wall biosynthesis